MAYYMLQATYTSETWQTLVNHPQDRVAVVRSAVEKLGGRLEGAWYAFGDYDVVLILQLPDNVTATALAVAFAVGGAFRAQKTTPLMAISEGIQAMKIASAVDYHPPAN